MSAFYSIGDDEIVSATSCRLPRRRLDGNVAQLLLTMNTVCCCLQNMLSHERLGG